MFGDIIVQKRSGLVGWFISIFTRSDYVHCGIEVESNEVVHVDWKGKRYSKIDDWGEIIRLRLNAELDDKALANIQFLINAFTVKGYDFFSAIKSWLWKNPQDAKYTGNYYQCAEFVSSVFREGTGIDLVPGCSDDTTQPQYFLTSPRLCRIC
jgi:hypothetical protein